MKPTFELVQAAGQDSFLTRSFNKVAFKAPYHYHPEYELTLILKGNGTRYVGNNMERFEAGDLVFLGENLPHCWKTEPKSTEDASAIVIQFTADFLGKDFFSKPEMKDIHQLFYRSKNGIQFMNKTHSSVTKQIKTLSTSKNNFEKTILLLNMLQQLALSSNYHFLDPKNILASFNRNDQERINRVMAYIVENYKKGLSLKEAAGIAHMTTTAFCKYFKKITRQTFMDMVINYRIHYATQQLLQTNNPISAICYNCGFGDVSHFNKTFKSKMKMTPLQYRKKSYSNTSTP